MLLGEHVGLRAVTADDLPALLEWRNRPEFRQYFREYRELSPEMQRQWFDNVVLNDPNVRMFSVCDRQDGQLIGACGLCYIDWYNRSADFSLYVGHDNLYIDGKYAVDAARVLVRYGFEELGLRRVWSEIYAFDEAKKAMFSTLGFALESEQFETHWTHGRWVNSLFFSLLSEEYLAGAAR